MVGRQAFPIGFWPLFRGELFSTREGRVKQCFLSKNWLIWLHCGRIGWIHGHTESWRWWNCCTFLDGRFWLDQWTNGICLESNRIMIQMNERATLRGLWCYFWKWITIFWNSLGHSPQKCFFVVAFQIVGQNLESQKTVSFHNHHPPPNKTTKTHENLMHRDPVVSSLLKSAASNKDHWCVVRWDPAQICIGKPSRWERWGGWSDGGGESDIFWVVRLRVREVRDNGYWWKSLVISEISWNLEKVTYSKLRWTGLSRGPMILCHRTPTSWAPKSIWDVFERRIVRGAFWKAGHHVHCYYLLWSKELLPNGSWKPLQYKQESLEWLPHYLLFKSQFHPLTESFTDVRFPPPKKKTTLYQQILHLMGLHAIRNLRYWTQIPVLFVHLLAIQSPLNPPRKELPLRQNARTSFSCWTRS